MTTASGDRARRRANASQWTRVLPYLLSAMLFLVSETTWGLSAGVADVDLGGAVEIARAEAVRRGYRVASMEVGADDTNLVWSSYLTLFQRRQDPFSEVTAKLKHRRFLAVHFMPRVTDPPRTGGDVWVFVDRDSGEVITVLKGY